MGGGGSKKKNIEQPTPRQPTPPRQPSPIQEEVNENRSATHSPQSPPAISRRSSVKSQAPSMHSMAISTHSQKSTRNTAGLPNGTQHQIPFRELDNNSARNSDDVSLTNINNQVKNSKSRSSKRSASQASSVVPLPQVHRPPTGSSAGHNKHVHRKSTSTSHGHDNHCSHCPHCQRKQHLNISSSPIPKWITENPGSDEGHILMDKYDIEAVKKKFIAENGHLPGSYDYQPQLTIEQVDDFDQIKENYYTQPALAKMAPGFVIARTPFPEYDALQRREQRINKPNTLPLFDD